MRPNVGLCATFEIPCNTNSSALSRLRTASISIAIVKQLFIDLDEGMATQRRSPGQTCPGNQEFQSRPLLLIKSCLHLTPIHSKGPGIDRTAHRCKNITAYTTLQTLIPHRFWFCFNFCHFTSGVGNHIGSGRRSARQGHMLVKQAHKKHRSIYVPHNRRDQWDSHLGGPAKLLLPTCMQPCAP